jgi:hypothetical protein
VFHLHIVGVSGRLASVRDGIVAAGFVSYTILIFNNKWLWHQHLPFDVWNRPSLAVLLAIPSLLVAFYRLASHPVLHLNRQDNRHSMASSTSTRK